jgi:hypothetical protein
MSKKTKPYIKYNIVVASKLKNKWTEGLKQTDLELLRCDQKLYYVEELQCNMHTLRGIWFDSFG